MKVLQFINWLIFGLLGTTAMLWIVTSIMLAPHQDLLDDGSDSMSLILTVASITIVLAAISGTASWLLVKHHPLKWLAQGVLWLSLAGALLFMRSQGGFG